MISGKELYWIHQIPQFCLENSSTVTSPLPHLVYPIPEILAPITWRTWATLGILIVMLLILMTDKIAAWFLMFATSVILNLIDVLSINDIEIGFSVDALFVVIMVVICMETFNRTNLLRRSAPYIFGTGSNFFWTRLNLARMVIFVTLVSAFVANAALVIVFLPVIKDWCRSQGFKSGKYLMPLLHAILNGGVFTQIGNAASILVYGQTKVYGITTPGFFEPIYVGGPLFIINLIYICTIGYWLLPDTGGLFHFLDTKGKAFLTEIVIDKGSKQLIGQTVKSVLKKLHMSQLSIVEIIRKVPSKATLVTSSVSIEKEAPNTIPSQVDQSEIVTPNPNSLPPKVDPQIEQSPLNVTMTTSPPSHKSESQSETISQELVPVRISMDTVTATVNLDVKNDKMNGKIDSFSIFPVKDTEIVQEGDRIMLSGDISSILKTREMKPLEKMVTLNDHFEVKEMITPVHPRHKVWKSLVSFCVSSEGDSTKQKKMSDVFEVVLSGSNPLLGKTLKESEFAQKYECSILAIKKRGYNSQDPVTTNLASVQLDYGDNLLILSKADFKSKWDIQPDFYVILKYQDDIPDKTNKIITIRETKFNIWWYSYLCYPLFFAAVLVAALSSVLNLGFPLTRCLLILIVVYVLTFLLSPEDVMKKVPIALILLIAFSIVIGQAVITSGLAKAFGDLIQLMNMPNYCLPGVFMFLGIVLTQFVHNDAVGAIFIPLVYGVSKTLECNSLPLTIATIMAANASFLTPFGFECNMMIQGPGGYKMKDYVIFGFPSVVIYFVGGSVLIPLIWPV